MAEKNQGDGLPPPSTVDAKITTYAPPPPQQQPAAGVPAQMTQYSQQYPQQGAVPQGACFPLVQCVLFVDGDKRLINAYPLLSLRDPRCCSVGAGNYAPPPPMYVQQQHVPVSMQPMVGRCKPLGG